MAKENRDWGYDRIAGTLANLGYEVCDQTVGNILQRHALPPAPERKHTTTWPAFIRTPYGQKIETVEKRGSCVCRRSLARWPRLRFLGGPIADRLAWRTNELGAHPGLRHGD